jgi:hypothetical protein
MGLELDTAATFDPPEPEISAAPEEAPSDLKREARAALLRCLVVLDGLQRSIDRQRVVAAIVSYYRR